MPAQSKRVRVEDTVEYPVEAILSHKGRKCNIQTMKFLVKWAGYGSKENTWEPFDGLKEVGTFQDYLKGCVSLSSLIPQLPMLTDLRETEVNSLLVKRFFDSFDQDREDKKQLINTYQHYKSAKTMIEGWIKHIGKKTVLNAIYLKLCPTAKTEYVIYVGFRTDNHEVKYLRMLGSTAERILIDYGMFIDCSKQNTK